MNKIELTKMTAVGNDFILVDGRTCSLPEPREKFIQKICSRRLSIGADGFLILKKSKLSHFKVTYYNNDGSPADLCLNGTRCAARFAYKNVLAPKKMKIETDAGVFRAEILSSGVNIELPTRARVIIPLEFPLEDTSWSGHLVDVGVPHLIIRFDSDLETLDFIPLARTMRFHPLLQPEGANVSFIQVEDERLVRIRTYERGIEDEMLSCSSGSWAALFALLKQGIALESPVQVLPKCLIPLNFHFDIKDRKFSSLSLQAEARFVFTATVDPEAWNWGA